MGTLATEVLERSDPGGVLTVFSDDVDLARRRLRAAAEEQQPVPTLVALEWNHAPSLARELDEIRDALARAAATLWPNWYITAERRFEQVRLPELDPSLLVDEVTRSAPGASASWLREAWQRCREGKLPVVPQMVSAEQVRQLSRALDPSRLVFALSVELDDAPPARIRGLARAAEWLANESQAKTLLVAPASWHGHPELDHVAYGALTLQTDEAPPAKKPSERAPGTDAATRAGGPATNADLPRPDDAPVQVLVGPIVGKPHPGSEVEQLLCERLSADDELGGLFEYNQRLAGFGGKLYIVDLVWRKGRLVVELDGPEHHGHLTYVKDRDRDYRLYMTGYTTLRIPNDEVYVDVECVLAKIKNVVGRLNALSKGKTIDEF